VLNYTCKYKGVQLKFKHNTLDFDRSQDDRPAACVIAQQYSSVTFFSLRIHSHNENFGVFKSFYFTFDIHLLKLRKLTLRKSVNGYARAGTA
jgi:hypothetical protein